MQHGIIRIAEHQGLQIVNNGRRSIEGEGASLQPLFQPCDVEELGRGDFGWTAFAADSNVVSDGLASQRRAHPVKVAQDFPLGPQHARLVVGSGPGKAEGPNYFLRRAQLVAGHVGEQVVLDLEVEAAVHEVDHQVGLDVSRRYHLFGQIVHFVVFIQDGHALVIGSENKAHMQAEQHLVDHDECYRVPGRQQVEQQEQIDHKVPGE